MRAEAEVRGDHRFQPRPRSIRIWRGEMVLTGINQLWVADITYIRLEEEFVYLAVILDAFSRRVIGWALDDDGRRLTLAALRMALASRNVRAGTGASFRPRCTVRQRRLHRSAERQRHHDQHEPQGKSLGQRGLRIVHENPEIRGGVPQRISRPGRGPRSIERFLEKVYNEKRLHSALGYRPPAEFERSLPQSGIRNSLKK